MRPLMANSDLNRIINSDEIQSIVNAPKTNNTRAPLKKNPLKNFGAMMKLNPYAQTATRMQLLSEMNRKVRDTPHLLPYMSSANHEVPRTIHQYNL
jgi:large subunit ribosomal protein L4e